MEEMNEHVCIICSQNKKEGITIVSQFVCEDCESEIVHTNAEDAKYHFFIHQLKQIVVPNKV
ncbi:Inhibitor of sigma-G Gin [Paenibacillus uliginis N3/975]|uniref:Inhibitor of sigma-G Gin n=1 Tax=Paenibacillus uliginis N3/975 TaxID=1313296 RepID=A0A1X7HTH7_9BACL|nr:MULTISPECIES: sigma factor G inhibitor Gin [Paenibacillus]UNK18502.1 sigma factor G inhibitor Gin [Paenibacillus sp. N3/727]SMF92744.1 Inhibitor of sigma-G Gin [Paenibacillus uliginis N3/975]